MGNTLNLQCWDTAVSGNPNGNADAGINLVEGQLPGDLNDAGRAIMASARRYAKDVGGALAAGGTANALTVATSQNLSAAHLAAGLFLAVRATADNTSATVTFAVDGLTAAPIKRSDGSALAVGSIKNGAMLLLFYNPGSNEFRAANILPNAAISGEAFPAGTVMLFVQTSAPTGWTKSATHNDKALRVVSGTAGSGGSSAFSTVFGKTVTDAHTLTASDIPSHAHSVSGSTGAVSNDHTHTFSGTTGGPSINLNHSHTMNYAVQSNTAGGGALDRVTSLGAGAGIGASSPATINHDHSFSGTTSGISANHTHTFSATSGAAGSGGSHTHGMDVRVQYVDVIIATKD